ncbi:hypothetical protein D9619_006724 [Psilocybe cf. subviscida]|uniref:Uncharacterized protein n=1 Tax=Psilocybe cf. subviscida TaxID=2480587 RepID=A0A8H5B6M7_9AGAR|nr:hypothetical protein D9619_006724 [Psilocybe cf. subviscida]
MVTTPTTPRAVEKGSLPTPITQGTENLTRRETLLNSLRSHWDNFKAHIGTSAALSSDSITEEPDEVNKGYKLHVLDASSINETIVDRNWADDLKSPVTGGDGKSGGSHPTHTAGNTDQTSVAVDGFWDSWAFLAMLRRRAWPAFMEIFSLRFADEKAEWQFCQESWYLKKKLALWASLWLIVNWVLGCIFIPHNPTSTRDTIFYYGVRRDTTLFSAFIV